MITDMFGLQDLFATKLNRQITKFVSWRPDPDPDALHIDVFTLNWHSLYFYAFPPFSVLWEDTSEGGIGSSNRHHNSPSLDNTATVCSNIANVSEPLNYMLPVNSQVASTPTVGPTTPTQ